MLNRQIRRAGVKVLYWIATRRHDLGHEPFGGSNRPIRVVDEHPLNARPFPSEALGLFARQSMDLQITDTLGALSQECIGLCR